MTEQESHLCTWYAGFDDGWNKRDARARGELERERKDIAFDLQNRGYREAAMLVLANKQPKAGQDRKTTVVETPLARGCRAAGYRADNIRRDLDLLARDLRALADEQCQGSSAERVQDEAAPPTPGRIERGASAEVAGSIPAPGSYNDRAALIERAQVAYDAYYESSTDSRSEGERMADFALAEIARRGSPSASKMRLAALDEAWREVKELRDAADSYRRNEEPYDAEYMRWSLVSSYLCHAMGRIRQLELREQPETKP